MDPSYQTVVDPLDIVWTMFAYAIHGGIVAMHVGLVGYLLVSGVRRLLGSARAAGALRVVLALALLAPLAVGAPMIVSLAASVAAFVVLLLPDEATRGRWLRRTALCFAAVVSLFTLWEREDNLALGRDVVLPAMEWRNEELSWQLAQDVQSPKVGDLAPDFELQDPEGVTQVRLSDFRGKRPVALVFGSYT